MKAVLEFVLAWGEVWAPFIPIAFIKSVRDIYLKPVIYYVILCLFLNTCANIISNQRTLGIELPWHNNVLFYNVQSIFRVVFFTWFFTLLDRSILKNPFKRILFVSLITLYVVVNVYEVAAENFLLISSYSYAIESTFLLLLCINYYFFFLKQSQVSYFSLPSFWIATGLSIFLIIGIPVYLFYKVAALQNQAIPIWKIQKIGFMFFCILIAIGFYVSGKLKKVSNE